MSAATDLVAVESAITNILTNGQESSTADGKSIKFADLQTLYDRKADLQDEIAKASTSIVQRTVAEY